jgi:hypothetical protein
MIFYCSLWTKGSKKKKLLLDDFCWLKPDRCRFRAQLWPAAGPAGVRFYFEPIGQRRNGTERTMRAGACLQPAYDQASGFCHKMSSATARGSFCCCFSEHGS